MVVQKFSENFWSPDFASTVGFDALVKKNKDGKTSSKEIEYFIKERAKIEDEYAKSLLKLSKASLGSTESGSLKDVLTSLRNNVEKLSYLHQDLSQILLDQVDRVHAERDKFSSQCKVVEESVKRLQGIKKDLHKQTIASSISYQKKSEAYEVSIQACNAERAQAQSIGNPPKALRELEKLEAKSLNVRMKRLRPMTSTKDWCASWK
ncbi:PSTPIP1 [Bugula neritina]|uniref:PSTPIP1 n=1 Tax=Bugula neritina TaxID=10212 RepID=A0A7J7JPC6_BUGNE|nr:PSTPIP1 [Bugula neritina]